MLVKVFIMIITATTTHSNSTIFKTVLHIPLSQRDVQTNKKLTQALTAMASIFSKIITKIATRSFVLFHSVGIYILGYFGDFFVFAFFSGTHIVCMFLHLRISCLTICLQATSWWSLCRGGCLSR